jgi:succinyl-CoA synthetase beta subunit
VERREDIVLFGEPAEHIERLEKRSVTATVRRKCGKRLVAASVVVRGRRGQGGTPKRVRTERDATKNYFLMF